MRSVQPALPLIFASALTAVGIRPSLAQTLIPLQTDSTALVYQVAGNKHLNLLYLGPAADAPKDGSNASGDIVYPTNVPPDNAGPYGSEEQPGQVAVRATHADGDLTSDLIYVGHTTKQVSNGVNETKIELKDIHHP